MERFIENRDVLYSVMMQMSPDELMKFINSTERHPNVQAIAANQAFWREKTLKDYPVIESDYGFRNWRKIYELLMSMGKIENINDIINKTLISQPDVAEAILKRHPYMGRKGAEKNLVGATSIELALKYAEDDFRKSIIIYYPLESQRYERMDIITDYLYDNDPNFYDLLNLAFERHAKFSPDQDPKRSDMLNHIFEDPRFDSEKLKPALQRLLIKPTKWSLRRVMSIPKLTYKEQLEILNRHREDLEEDELKLLDNPEFVDAYLSTNEELANLLNQKKVPWFPHINHAAAAVIISLSNMRYDYEQIYNYLNSLVPHRISDEIDGYLKSIDKV